jgi:squalene-associated FAD-dependent desaturase
MSTAHVVVIGGGLAGLSAAIAAADAGWRVTVVESRPRLGGATTSFPRAFEGGQLDVDNGQHVFLRCCTVYLAFLERLGVVGDTWLQPRLDVPVVDATTRRRGRLARDPLPAPLHLSRSLLTYGLLSPLDRVRAIYGALALRFVKRDEPATDAQSFAAWLREHRQNDATISRLFDVFTVATLNAPADRASLSLAAMVFQDGLLRHAGAADIGVARVPLGRLHGEAALQALEKSGAEVLLRTRAHAIEARPNGWRVVTGDSAIDADAVIVAVPHEIAADLLPAQARVDAEAMRSLESAPILNVHVIYDRTVMNEPFLAAVGSPAQFIFDRTRPSGLSSGQYLAISVSAARDWIERPVGELRSLFLAELATILPATRTAVVRDFFVTREKTATFAPGPGSRSRRLATRTSAPGILLAGAWTDTGWPATMEGAVRSGGAAASALTLPASNVSRRGLPETPESTATAPTSANAERETSDSSPARRTLSSPTGNPDAAQGNETARPGVETAEEALA